MSQYMFHPFDGGMGTSLNGSVMCLNFKIGFRNKIGITGEFMIELMPLLYGETINLCGKRLDGFTEKKYFIELVGKLQAIRKNIDRYYPDEKRVRIVTLTREGASGMKKKPLIFISHSSKNKDQVAKIADLLRSINLSPR